MAREDKYDVVTAPAIRRTTIYDVAEHAEVSPATVSRVLNGRNVADAEMAARVRRSVAMLGYRPSQVARSMRTRRTYTVAVVVPDIENPFFTAVVRGIEDEGRSLGMMAVVCNTDNDVERERAYLQLAVDQQMDGVILATDQPDLGALGASGPQSLTTVLVDREPPAPELDAVLVDNGLGARLATEQLIAAGARRVACIAGPAGVTTSVQRVQGYLDVLRANKLRRERVLIRHADYHSAGGRAAMAALLDLGERRPDAVLVCNNQMTMGALQELRDRGVGVPDEMLLVGFDDEPWAAYWSPPVSTVAQPAREVGRTAMRLLIDRLDRPDRAARRVVLLPSIRVRHSSVPAGVTPGQ